MNYIGNKMRPGVSLGNQTDPQRADTFFNM